MTFYSKQFRITFYLKASIAWLTLEVIFIILYISVGLFMMSAYLFMVFRHFSALCSSSHTVIVGV